MSATVEQLAGTPVTGWPLPTRFDPRPFQLEAVRRGRRQNLIMDVGLGGGKTTMALAIAENLGAMRVLVICPSKVIPVWPDEISENAARDWTVWSGKVTGAHGKPLKNPSVARRAEALIEANKGAMHLRTPFMAVVNYEAVIQKQMYALLIGTAWDMLIVDESHKIAGAGAKTSMQIARIADRVRDRHGRVLLGTGTFMPHSALSVYGQFRTLDRQVLGNNWNLFKSRYAKWRIIREVHRCDTCGRESRAQNPAGQPCGQAHCPGTIVEAEPIYHTTPLGQKIPDGVRPEREQELLNRIRPHVLRVSQAELDEQTGLVETPPQLRTCTLDAATRRVYDDLEKHLIAQVKDGTITAANAMVSVTRLAQVTSGYGVNATTGDIIQISDGQPAKARLLADELEDLDPREPVVIFARFHHDFDQIEAICQAQGRRYGEISGRSASGLDGHYMHPDIDVVAVQPQSGGAGINLTRARLCIFYTSDFNLANYDQAKRRVLRQGQTRHVTYLHLVADDTVDVNTFYALKKRRDSIHAVLDRLTQGDRP